MWERVEKIAAWCIASALLFVFVLFALSALLYGCGDEEPTFKPGGPPWSSADFPQFFALDPTMRGYELERNAALSTWNEALGGEYLFDAPETRSEYAGGAIATVEMTDGDSGESKLYKRGGEPFALRVCVPYGSRRPARRIAHEIGHGVFGLAHDADPDSIMYPDSESGGAWVTEADREAIINWLHPP
jgi:hypothetical protein